LIPFQGSLYIWDTDCNMINGLGRMNWIHG
jgi:hypothetical protein